MGCWRKDRTQLDLVVLGHASGPQGEVSYARKLMEIATARGARLRLVDVFDLFPGAGGRERLSALAGINVDAAYRDEVDTDPRDHADARMAHEQWMRCGQQTAPVFLATTAYQQLGLAKVGIVNHAPTIAWYYPYVICDEPLFRAYFRRATMVVTYSPIGVRGLLANGVPDHRIVLLPIPYAPIADSVNQRPRDEAWAEARRRYLEDVAAKMGKRIRVRRSTRVFGVFARLTPMYNQPFILRHFARIAPHLEDTVLLVKSPDTDSGDPAFDAAWRRAVEAVRDEPWFLWDKTFDSHETLHQRYTYLDVGIFLAGAGQAAVEMASVGVSLLLLDIPYNRSLFEDLGVFVRCAWFGADQNLSKPDGGDFCATVLDHALMPAERFVVSRATIRRRATARFSLELVHRRLMLAVAAARAYFHAEPGAENLRRRVRLELEQERAHVAAML